MGLFSHNSNKTSQSSNQAGGVSETISQGEGRNKNLSSTGGSISGNNNAIMQSEKYVDSLNELDNSVYKSPDSNTIFGNGNFTASENGIINLVGGYNSGSQVDSVTTLTDSTAGDLGIDSGLSSLPKLPKLDTEKLIIIGLVVFGCFYVLNK